MFDSKLFRSLIYGFHKYKYFIRAESDTFYRPALIASSVRGIWIFFITGARKLKVIDDIAFELLAVHCGIGRGIRKKKIPQEK